MTAGAASSGSWWCTGSSRVHALGGDGAAGGRGAAVLVSATAFTVWNQSNVNEKVYTVSLFTIALLSWLAFLWRDHVEEHRGRPRAGAGTTTTPSCLMVFVLALSVGNHLMAFLAAPGDDRLPAAGEAAGLPELADLRAGRVFAVIGLSVHLYLPIRAG
jgi:hypothetical protein